MDLNLIRTKYFEEGIFGELRTDDAEQLIVGVTLEHAFPGDTNNWVAKIPEGEYLCIRGEHYLHGMDKPFETFEVTGIEGHWGLLFHWGNFNKDSEGCILLGDQIRPIAKGPDMIINSKKTFQKFMDLQENYSTFSLRVIG